MMHKGHPEIPRTGQLLSMVYKRLYKSSKTATSVGKKGLEVELGEGTRKGF